jgi:hypothetical protein
VLVDNVARTVFFEAGNVVGAKSEVAGERLGEVMYKLGALTAAQVQAVIARMPFEKKRFGETAVQLGFVAREQLFHFAAKQTEEIFFAMLLVARGSFFFLDGYDEARLTARMHFSAAALLMQGVSRMDEIKYFRERIPSQEHVPARADQRTELPAELLEAWPSLAKVFAVVDGRRSVLEIGRACGLSEFEVTHALFQLLQATFVAVNPPMPSTPEAIVAIHNDAMRRVFALAAKHRRDGALREHLARYSSSVGVLDELIGAAGPASDGALDTRRVLKSIASMAGDEQQTSLSQWLHAYVAFALFDIGADVPKEEHAELAREVRKCLALLAPRSIGSVPPPGSTRGLSQRPTGPIPRSAQSSAQQTVQTVRAPEAAPATSPVPPAVAPFVPSSPPPPEVAPVPEMPPKSVPGWPPPRPFASATGKPSGVIALRQPPALAPPPHPSSPALKATQRIHAPPPPPPRPPSTPRMQAIVSAGPPAIDSKAAALGKTQMNVQQHPALARPGSGGASSFTGSPDQAFDALALAERAVPAAHVSAAPPPAPMNPPYVPSVPPPPAGTPQVPSMDELLDVDDVIATQERAAAKPRRRVGMYVVIAFLFCGSALGAYALFLSMRGGNASTAVATPPQPETEQTEESAPKKKKPKDDETEKSSSKATAGPAIASASASSSASVAASAKASAKPSASASSAPSAVPSTVPSVAPTTSTSSKVAAGMGVLRTPPASTGRRVFVDGKVVGEGPGPFTLPCGVHTVKVGSAGKDQKLDVPCGGEITAPIL